MMATAAQNDDSFADSYTARRQALTETAADRLLSSVDVPEPQVDPTPGDTVSAPIGVTEPEGDEGIPVPLAGVTNPLTGVPDDPDRTLMIEALPTAVLGGARDAVQELIDLGTEVFSDDATQPFITLPEVPDDDRAAPQIARVIAQFLTGFIPAFRGLRGLGAGAGMASVGAGMLADATVFDPVEKSLAEAMQEVPALENPVAEFLSTQPGDTRADARLKNAIEGVVPGVLIEGFVKGIRVLRASRIARGSGDETAETVAADFTALGNVESNLTSVSGLTSEQAGGFLRVTTEGGDRAININLARLETTDQVREIINRTARVFSGQIDEARRGVQSNELTQRLADDLGMTVPDLLSRRQGQAFNAEQALAARSILVSSGENLTALASKVGGPNATEVDMVAFQRALAVHKGIQQQVSGLTAEAGRALQQFRIPAGADAQRTRAIQEMIRGGDTELSRDIARRLSSLENPQEVNAFVRQADRATSSDMALEIWINALLSGPQTHAVNTLSNTIVAGLQMPERLLASGISKALNTQGGGVQVGEMTAQAFGLVQGMKDGLILGTKAFRQGEPSDAFTKIEVRKHRAITGENLSPTLLGRGINAVTGGSLERGGIAARAVDLMGHGFRIPGRFLMAEDEYFKAVGYRMELNATAFRKASSEGLEGAELAQRVRQVVNDPPPELAMVAIDAARYQTFTKELGQAGRSVQRIANSHPYLRVILPFIRTPTNIMKFVGERTALAPLSRVIRADIAAGGARRDLALARISMGSMVMAVVADQTMSGNITGGGPTEPGVRAAMKRQGWQPYSIKVGNTYHSYSRLEPFGSLLGISADMTEISGQTEETDADELAGAAVIAVANNIVSKTYLRSLSELLTVFNQVSPAMGAQRGERFLKNLAGTVIPTGIAQIERVVDPTLRETRSMLDQIKSRIPSWSETLPPRRNLWGEPIALKGGLGPDIMSPIYTNELVDSPVDREIVRLKAGISMPPRVVNGVELTSAEYSRFVELAGAVVQDPSSGLTLKPLLERLIKSPEYQRQSDGPDGGKSLVMRSVVVAMRALAREQLSRRVSRA